MYSGASCLTLGTGSLPTSGSLSLCFGLHLTHRGLNFLDRHPKYWDSSHLRLLIPAVSLGFWANTSRQSLLGSGLTHPGSLSSIRHTYTGLHPMRRESIVGLAASNFWGFHSWCRGTLNISDFFLDSHLTHASKFEGFHNWSTAYYT